MTEPLDNALPDDLLPELPAPARKALDLVGKPGVDPAELIMLIKADEHLVSRILRAANSGHLKLPERCTSIEGAMTHLGLHTVRLLAIGFGLVDLTQEMGQGLDVTEFWRRCFYSAAAARRIAVVTGSCNPEVVFIAGLLQDIGMLAMLAALGDRYRELLLQAGGSHQALPDLERACVGFTHADAGAHLGVRWGLNADLVAPIKLHHQMVTGLDDCDAAISAVALATRMSEQDDLESILDMSKQLFDLTAEQTESLMEQTARDTQGLSGLLELKDTPQPPPVDLRALLEQELARRYETARTRDGCLGLIIGELDTLEGLSTRFGAGARQRAVEAMFERARLRAAADGGEPLRLPDGRFAIVVPGAGRTATAMIAERLRQDVAGAPFPIRDDDGRVESMLMSVSAGAAALEPGASERLGSPDLLLTVAEKALKAAVSAGRDCVRVFSPRPQGGGGRSHAA